MSTVITTLGEMPTHVLKKQQGHYETADEVTVWVEYWFEGALVHRSATIHLKHPLLGAGAAAVFG